jgi:hypothetical protein
MPWEHLTNQKIRKEKTLEELKIHVNKLKQLLDDSQPGLMCWCESYAYEMNWISNYWENN